MLIRADRPGTALGALGFHMHSESCHDVVTRGGVLVAPGDMLRSASSPLVSGAAEGPHDPGCQPQSSFFPAAQRGPTGCLTALLVLGARTPEACCWE